MDGYFLIIRQKISISICAQRATQMNIYFIAVAQGIAIGIRVVNITAKFYFSKIIQTIAITIGL